MFVDSVYYELDGVLINRHPDAGAQDTAENKLASIEWQNGAFVEYIDSAPNYNGVYAEEIELATAHFAKEGKDLPPATIVASEDYDRGMRILGQSVDTGAIFGAGRLVVREDEELVGYYGKDFILGLLLHEGAHATAKMARTIIVGKNIVASETADDIFLDRHIHVLESRGGGTIKYSLNPDGSANDEGVFFEEGYADLTRVKTLREMNREPQADDRFLPLGNDLLLLGEGWKIPPTAKYGRIALPVEYANGVSIRPGVPETVYVTPPVLAGYGLDLLDGAVPGIYDGIKASRNDPKLYRGVIEKIDSIRPRLYRDLRRLSYSHDDFRHGLQLVKDAVA